MSILNGDNESLRNIEEEIGQFNVNNGIESSHNNGGEVINAELAKAYLSGKIPITAVFSKKPTNSADFLEKAEDLNSTTADSRFTEDYSAQKNVVVVKSNSKKGRNYKLVSFNKKLAFYLQKANKMRKPDITGALVFNTILSWWTGSYRMKSGKKIAFKSFEGLQKDLPFLERSTIKRAVDRIRVAFPNDFELIKSTKAETNYSITEELAAKYVCNYSDKQKWKNVITFRNDIANGVGVLPAIIYNLPLHISRKKGGELYCGYKYVDVNISGMTDIIPSHAKTLAEAFRALIDAGLVKKAFFESQNKYLYSILSVNELKAEIAHDATFLDGTQRNRFGAECNSNGVQRNSFKKLDINNRYLEIEEPTSQAQLSSFSKKTNNMVNTADVEAPPKHSPLEKEIVPFTENGKAALSHTLAEGIATNVPETDSAAPNPFRRSAKKQLLAESELISAEDYAQPPFPPSSPAINNTRNSSQTPYTGISFDSHPGTAELRSESFSLSNKELEEYESILEMQCIYFDQIASRSKTYEHIFTTRITVLKSWFKLLTCPDELVVDVLDAFGTKIKQELDFNPRFIEFLKTKKELRIDRLSLIYDNFDTMTSN